MANIVNTWTASSGARVTSLQVTVGTITEGNLLLALVFQDGNDGFTTSDGFTQVGSQDGNGQCLLTAWGKVAGASEPSTYTWNLNATDEMGIIVMEIEGTNVSATMSDNIKTAGNSAISTLINPAPVTGVSEGDLGLIAIATDTQVTLQTPETFHTPAAYNPVYADNDATALVQFFDYYVLGTTYDPGSTYVSASTEIACLSIVVVRGDGILATEEPLGTLEGQTASILSGQVYQANHFRFRKDDGTETTATWQEALDTDTTWPLDDPVRLRFSVDALTEDSTSESASLQYRKNGNLTGTTVAITLSPVNGTNYNYGDGMYVSKNNTDLIPGGTCITVGLANYSTDNGRVYTQTINTGAYDYFNSSSYGLVTGGTNAGVGDKLAVDDYHQKLSVYDHATDTFKTYYKSGSNWIKYTTELSVPTVVYDCSMSGDGQKLFVRQGSSGNQALRIYTWNSGTSSWNTSFTTLTTGRSGNQIRGFSSNTDASRLVITGYTDWDGYGYIHTFEDTGSGLTRVVTPQNLGGDLAADGLFGWSCHLFEEAGKPPLLAVGNPNKSTQRGGVEIYEWDDTVPDWILKTIPYLGPYDAGADATGISVALYRPLDGILRLAAGMDEYDATYSGQGGVLIRRIDEGWRNVGAAGTTTEDVIFYDSVNVTHNGATTQQISAGSFDAGKIGENDPISLVVTGSNVTEAEWVVQMASARNVNGDYIDFRMTGGANFSTFAIPRLTLGGISQGVIVFTPNGLTLGTYPFNRMIPDLVNWQAFERDGDIDDMTPKGFPLQSWIQADDEAFVCLMLCHFIGKEPVALNLGWLYSLDLGQTWNVITTTATTPVEIISTSYWTNGASYTNKLTHLSCSAQMTAEKMNNDWTDTVTPTGEGYCKEYAQVFTTHAEYLDDSVQQIWIAFNEQNYGDFSVSEPIKFIRTSKVPFNAATLDMSFTQPAITNLPVIFNNKFLALNPQPMTIPHTYRVIGWSVGGVFWPSSVVDLSKQETGTLLIGKTLECLVYSEGYSPIGSLENFRFQVNPDGTGWVNPTVSTGTVINQSHFVNWNASGTDDFVDIITIPYQYTALDDDVDYTAVESAFYAYSTQMSYIRTQATGGFKQAHFIRYSTIGFGSNTPDGAYVDIRLVEYDTEEEVFGSQPYFRIYCDHSLGRYDVVSRGARLFGTVDDKYPTGWVSYPFYQGEQVQTHQTHVRFRYDDGSETSSPWVAPVNTNGELNFGVPFRVRMGINAVVYDNNQEPTNVHNYTLQYKQYKAFCKTSERIEVSNNGGLKYYYPKTACSSDTYTYGLYYTLGEYTKVVVINKNNSVDYTWELDDNSLIGVIGPTAVTPDDSVFVVAANNTGNGKIWTYDQSGGVWTKRTYEIPQYAGFNFEEVALTTDGTVLAAMTSVSNLTAIVIYEWNGGTSQWDFKQLIERDTVPDVPLDAYGYSIYSYNCDFDGYDRLYAFGTWASGTSGQGWPTMVYERSGSTWTLSDKYTHRRDFLLPANYSNGADDCTLSVTTNGRMYIHGCSTEYGQQNAGARAYCNPPNNDEWEWGYDVGDVLLSSTQNVTLGREGNWIYHANTTYSVRLFPVESDWIDVGALSATDKAIRFANSPHLTDGEVTTQQITSGTFVTGEVVESGTGDVTFNSTGDTEIEYVVESYSGLANVGDFYEFRVYASDLKPATGVTRGVWLGAAPVLFNTGSLQLGGGNGLITPQLFNLTSLSLADLYFENGYPQVDSFNGGIITLEPQDYAIYDTVEFGNVAFTLEPQGAYIDPTFAIVDQKDYRLRADDNYEASATYQGLLSQPWGQSVDEIFRLRYILENDVRSAPNQTHNYKPQYNLNNAGTFVVEGSAIERTASDALEEALGRDIAISGNGQVMAVGAPEYDSNKGRVYIYDKDEDSNWVYRSYLDAPTPAVDMYFGQGLALSFTGNQVFVGEPYKDVTYTAEGVVHVFIDSGSDFVFDETIESGATLNNNAHFGWSIDTNEAGSRLFIGIPNYTSPDPYTECGGFEIWKKTSGTWIYSEGKYLAGLDYAHFGTAIASSDNGEHLAVGVPDYNSPGIIIFWDLISGVWTIRSNAVGGSNSGEQFGSSIASNTTGRMILVGAPKFSGAEGFQGRAYIVDWNGDITTPDYTNRQTINNPDIDPGDNFGSGVAMASSGDFLAIGAAYNTNLFASQGAAYAYVPNYTWIDISTTTPVKYTDSSFITDGETTTQQLTSGNFDAGTVEEVGATQVTWTREGSSEVEFVFTVDSAETVQSDLFKIRLVETTNSLVPQLRSNTAQFEVFDGDVDRGELHIEGSAAMTADGYVEKANKCFMSTSTTMFAQFGGTQEVLELGEMHLATDSVLTAAGVLELNGIAAWSNRTSMTSSLTKIIYQLGAARWVCTTDVTSSGRVTYAGKTDLLTETAMLSTGHVTTYGALNIACDTTFFASGNYIRHGSLPLESQATLSLRGGLLKDASASWGGRTKLNAFGGLTKLGNCGIIGASNISIEAHIVRNAFANYSSLSYFTAIPTVGKTAAQSLATTATASMSGSMVRGATAHWLCPSRMVGYGTVLSPCKEESNITALSNYSFITPSVESTNITCGE